MRFLNATGGGVVRSFKGKDVVMVEDADGFEIPTYIHECVVVGEAPQVHSDNQPKTTPKEMEKKVMAQREITREEERKTEENPEGEQLNIFLAYLPTDEKAIQTCGRFLHFIHVWCMIYAIMIPESGRKSAFSAGRGDTAGEKH